ncbi:MAG: 1-acyl-sn-glycerol-3-phosphate acyltransferase, partial [Jatrophihabitantaceae bacterium]
VLAATFGIVAVLARLIDQLRRLVLRRPTRGRVWRLATLAAGYLLLDLIMVVGSFWLWLRAPLPGRRQAEQWRAEHVRLLRWVLRWLFAIAGRTLRFTVLLDEPVSTPPAGSPPLLVLARHAGPGDSFTLVHLIASYLGRCPRVVLKAALQWDPGLDVLLNRLSCCFLASATGAGEDRTEQLSALAAGLAADDALLLFPEGGNWTPRRWQRAIRRLRRQGRRARAEQAARNQHVLPPRPGGTLACLAAQPGADVLVVAHTGLADLVSPAQIWRALPLLDRHMLIGWWRLPVAALPAGDSGRADWLDEQWQLVDGWVAAHSTS